MKWKKIWNRLVDCYDKNEIIKRRLLDTEMSIFTRIKKLVENETGQWNGSKLQNRLADYKVASAIYNSFREYEKGLKRQGSFFNFKRK